ncbi:MAG: NAD(P)-dependent dehydrogenase, short-chain alcohol dehydrogenase family [Chloroflexi bacterium]|nr:MAG: NAD(P)-dependent dehydrogenase, short-chain alcohol dehydrogenase family [Chloroflexota bacterium]
MVNQAKAEFGRIDILVNNAAQPGGQAKPPTIDELDEVFWQDMNVKVLGYLRCARAVAPHMRERGWGRIVNISGLAARQSGALVGSIRNVSVAALTKNLADTFGPDGINVTVVHPGLTVTERTAEVLAARAADSGRPIDELRAELTENNSIRRAIDAADVANVVTFLASPLSVAINGDAIAVGGGVGRAIHY